MNFKFTGERKFGVALVIVGTAIIIYTQFLINKYRWIGMSPTGLVRYQEAGLTVFTAGVTLLIRPFIFNSNACVVGTKIMTRQLVVELLAAVLLALLLAIVLVVSGGDLTYFPLA